MAFPRGKKNLLSFNAGELSPKLDARVDTEKYSKGCRQCQNMIPMPHGGVTRRKGFEFVAVAGLTSVSKRVSFMRFQFSRTVAFMIEMGDLYMRFYTNGAQIESGGSPYELTTPYTSAQCAELQYAQINDVVYITHPSHPVYKLSRVADDNWTLAEVDFDIPPFLTENLTTTTIALSATTGTVTLTASAATFEAGHIGAYFEIGHRREATSVSKAITATGTSSSILVKGRWTFRTTGIWNATVRIDRSEDGSTGWEAVRSYTGTSDRNVDVEGEEADQAYYRINVTLWTSGSSSPNAIFEVADAFIYGVVQITAVASGTSATATVKRSPVYTAATKYWSEGAWSIKRGFPAACTLYEGRMFFAGTTHQPQTLWGSAVDDFENFDAGTADDDSVSFELASTERQQVLWMISQSRLIIGTTAGEWSADGGDLESAITPSRVKVRQQSNFGSQSTRALLVNDTVLFIQRSGRKLREVVYDAIREGYQSNDLTILSDHITSGGMKSPCYQSDRDSIVWGVAAGNLIGMTYEKEQSVIAWHRHVTDGTIESVETLYGGVDSEVWISVRRNINGLNTRYIERMKGYYTPSIDYDFPVTVTVAIPTPPYSLQMQIQGSIYNKTFLDSCVTFAGLPTTTITGLDHLNGETVDILADGWVHPPQVVLGGGITLEAEASVVHVGLPYDSIIQPMRLDLDDQAGNTQGMVKQIRGLTLRLLDTLGLSWADAVDGEFKAIKFRNTNDDMDEAPPLFTGDKHVEFEADFGGGDDDDTPEPTFVLKQDQPLPWTLIGAVVHMQTTGQR